jgi:hypothetical protein
MRDAKARFVLRGVRSLVAQWGTPENTVGVWTCSVFLIYVLMYQKRRARPDTDGVFRCAPVGSCKRILLYSHNVVAKRKTV